MQDSLILNANGVALQRPNASPIVFEDFSISKGSSSLLLGPSGSGKTTFLSILAGFLPPTSGSIHLKGKDLYRLPTSERDSLRGKTCGFIFQTLHLFPTLSVKDNILLACRMANNPLEHKYLDAVLKSLGIIQKSESKPHELSQGERQRVAIARAVINRPEIIIADEPTSSLDDHNAQITIDLIREHAEQTGAAILLATHDKRIMHGFSKVIELGHNIRKAS